MAEIVRGDEVDLLERRFRDRHGRDRLDSVGAAAIGRKPAESVLSARLEAAMAHRRAGEIAALVVECLHANGGYEEFPRWLAAWIAGRDGAGLDGSIGLVAGALRTARDLDEDRRALPLVHLAISVADRLGGRGARFAILASAVEGAEARLRAALTSGDSTAAEAAANALAGDASALEGIVLAGLPGVGLRDPALLVASAGVVELRRACGDEAVVPLLARLARSVAACRAGPINADAAAHEARIAAISDGLDDLAGAEDAEKTRAFHEPKFRRHLIDGRPEQAFKAMTRALAFGVPHDLLLTSVALAAAERMLRFHAPWDERADVREGWTEVSELVAVAAALRSLRQPLPARVWVALLLDTTWLVASAAPLDADEAVRFSLPDPLALDKTWDHGPELARLAARIQAHDAAGAIGLLRGYVMMALPEQPLCRQLAEAALFDQVATGPARLTLFAGTTAAIDEFNAAAEHPHRELLLCAALRLLTARPLERPVYGLALAAIEAGSGRPGRRRLTSLP